MEDIIFTPNLIEPVAEPQPEAQPMLEPSVITSTNARRKVQQSMVQLQEILKQLSGVNTPQV